MQESFGNQDDAETATGVSATRPAFDDGDETGFFEPSPAARDSRPGGAESTPASAPQTGDDGTEAFDTGNPGCETRRAAPADGETQMLETQLVSREELELLRGVHLRRRRRRAAWRGALLLLALGLAAGVYSCLSSESVSRYLLGDSTISFNRVITDPNGGGVSISLPNWRGGGASGAYRWDTMLGERGKVPLAGLRRALFGAEAAARAASRAFKWNVPFSVSITNWTDEASLREDRAATFERWWRAQPPTMRPDNDYTPPPLFLGGERGAYPGIRCLQRKYYRVDESGDNHVGTATFFRHGAQCYVLRRELPAEEEGRGWTWLGEVWSTLWAPARHADGSENLFAACHWEGSSQPDSARAPALLLDDCRKALDREDSGAWSDVERDLSLVLRAVHGRDDPDSAAIRSGAFDALRRLRAVQREFWNKQRLAAVKAASVRGNLEAVRLAAAAKFPSADDERHWLVQREAWWTLRPRFGGER